MVEELKKIWRSLEAVHGVIFFLIGLFAADLLWKLCIHGNENLPQVLLFGRYDIYAPFGAMVLHIAGVARDIVQFFGYETIARNANEICFANHHAVTVVWGCTAIKQSFIFLCIMLLSKGKWLHKTWYIPMGLLLIYSFNIIRIAAIAMIVANHPEQFVFWHEWVFKYAFYGMIFLIWLVWNEKFAAQKAN
ncbi:MAG: exosortase/archaeosortase family protein [Prevotellaceae bacterium]|jgi:exosortase family protein XrtF|nr:exosortase/archaeosortase family protein [Prevotellaceae bacterium]